MTQGVMAEARAERGDRVSVMRRAATLVTIAVVVLLIEFGATYGSVTGDPFVPVEQWGPTRPTDGLAFAMVILGCGALAFLGRFPFIAASVATASYCAFALRDYELGMFLAPMVAIFLLVATRGSRLAAALCALASLAAGLLWVDSRAETLTDSGTALLTWVAFGTVLAAFFIVPFLLGEIVRLRSLLRSRRGPAA